MSEDQPTIFISYARSDVNFAWQITNALQQVGAKVWLDVKDIPYGTNWSNAVNHALNTSKLMILIISPESMSSSNVADEWQYFFDENKSVIPIRFKPVEKLHFQLRRIQWVDFYEQPFASGFIRLIDELRRRDIPLKPLDTADTASSTQQKSSVSENMLYEEDGQISDVLHFSKIIENLLRTSAIDPLHARLEVETGFGWSFNRGSALIEIYLTDQSGVGYLQVLSPLIHMPPEDKRPPLYKRLLELNMALAGASLGIYMDVVYLFIETPLANLKIVEVNNIILRISSYANELNNDIVNEFGGRLYIYPRD